MIHAFFLIRSLGIGGAERQLLEMIRGLDKNQFAVTVATFYDGGALAPEMSAIEGVRLIGLGKRSRWDLFPFLGNLWKAVRSCRPDVLFGDMSPANELGWVMGRIVGARVVWALRSSAMDLSKYDWLPTFLRDLGALLSGCPDLIIVNSYAGRRSYEDDGYRSDRMIVVHNGIDTTRYRPNPDARARMRAKWKVAEDQTLVGLVARLDPVKDHPTFLRAAAIVTRQRPDTRFVCVGEGPEAYAKELRDLDRSLDVKVLWAGGRKDMTAVHNALDIACCSSDSEGFPNAVAEAMACGVPCVATDVGDLSILVGETGVIVPSGDSPALAAGMQELLARLEADEEGCRRRARERIISEFGLSRLVEKTTVALAALAAEGAG